MTRKRGGLADSPFFEIAQQDAAMPSSIQAPERPLTAQTEIFPAPRQNLPIEAEQMDNKLPSDPHNTITSDVDNKLTSDHPPMPEFIQSFLNMRNAQQAGFRYPIELIQKLEEVEYTARKRVGKKATKTSIAVAALAFFLWDYDERGEQSYLIEIFQ